MAWAARVSWPARRVERAGDDLTAAEERGLRACWLADLGTVRSIEIAADDIAEQRCHLHRFQSAGDAREQT
jgi:hypothetical protein